MAVFGRMNMKFCPLLRSECIGAKCAWWYSINTQHGECVVVRLIRKFMKE